MKIFVDNDVILDVLLERTNFEHSQRLLSQIENQKIEAYTSPLIFTNSFYIITRLKNKSTAWSALKKIRLLFRLAPVTEKVIDLALASDFADFEDAVEYYAALQLEVEYLVTRNKKDFAPAQVPVVTPQELLALWYNAAS